MSVYIHPIGRYAPLRNKKARAFDIVDPSQDGSAREFNVRIPADPGSTESTLVIYATAGFMAVWDRIQEDLDGYFAAGWRQVIIVLIQPEFRLLEFATHSYLLSLLLNNFPRRKYLTTLDIFSEEPFVATGPWSRILKRTATHLERIAKRVVAAFKSSESNSPSEFSALVISVKPTTCPNVVANVSGPSPAQMIFRSAPV